MPLNIALFGVQGSGKGTQAKLIADKHALPIFSPGAMYREAIKAGTEIGKIADEYINKGQLAPDDLTNRLMKERLNQADSQNGYILDGYPRSQEQAVALDEMSELTHVIVLDITDEEALKRISGRRICKAEGHIYHIEYNPSKVEGVCDHDGSELIQREDDKPNSVKERIAIYHTRTEPLFARYIERGIMHRVDASGSPEEVAAKLEELL